MNDADDSPMKLQCLAAKSICVRLLHKWAEGEIPVINVWKRAQGYGTDHCKDHDWFLWQLSEMQVPQFAYISGEIQNQIEDNMVPILETVYWWIRAHHGCNNFFHDQPSSPLNEYIVKLVWNHHFKIDRLATAKNILTNEKLSLLERFRFASVYCLVDEIEKFRGMIDSIPEFDFKADPFVAYWSKYLRNKLHTISVPKNNSSIEMLLFNTAMEHGLWPTVEYFFDKLDSAQKTSKFESILGMYGEFYRDDFSAGLARKKWNPLCCFASSKIIARIVRYGSPEQVRIVWKLFESKMNPKNFYGILETLVPLSMRNASEFEKWTPLLMEIWTDASNNLKQSAIDMKLWESIGEKFFDHFRDEHIPEFRARRLISDPMKFIRIVLKSMPAKKRFFEKNFCWLILWAPFAAVDELMRDGLEHYDRDVIELKKVIANDEVKTQWSLSSLLAYGEYDEIDAIISFYLPGIDRILETKIRNGVITQNDLRWYKVTFIMSPDNFDSMLMQVYRGDWKELYKYMEENISWVNPDTSRDVMIKLFMTTRRYFARKIDGGQMNDLKEFVSMIYSNTKPEDEFYAQHQLKFLKRLFENRLAKVLFKTDHTTNYRKKMTFDRAAVREFLLWIYDGDEKLMDKIFKQPRLFPSGFLVQLKGCVAEGCFQATESMDEFLKWCFATEAERQRFKRKMIYDYRQYQLIEGLLMRRKYRPRMLLWFFDGDAWLIEKFTADYGPSPIHGYYISDDSSDDSDEEDWD
ncbi:uncharacterized protein LOC135837942 [Planococcus citri]|uniref:uncharacterized protein LOC135837942 n=1 Tax=Planococcus citri TaxID=170843 RepID=UPI0031F86AAE